MTEKRKFARAPFQVAAKLCASDSEESFNGETVDISQGGIFLAISTTWEIGTEVELLVELPGMGSSKLPGFIRWKKADGVGVQFGLLGARETHAIGKIIRRAQKAS